MRESIYTIPLTEVFLPKCGCPMCRLANMLEERFLEYIMGAAMMEPSVRIETNKQGFCRKHLDVMSKMKNKLSLALILESHLIEINDNLEQLISQKNNQISSCYVCSQIKEAMEKLASNVLARYVQDAEFRKLYHEQTEMCKEHYILLCCDAKRQIGKKNANEFIEITTKITKETLNKKLANLKTFTKSYDYRNSNTLLDDEAKNSVEFVIKYLAR